MTLVQHSGKIVEKGSITNTAVSANANLFATGLTPSRRPLSEFVIYAVFQGAGKLKVFRTIAAGTTLAGEVLNTDVDLVANSAYVFSVPVTYGETINIQFTAAVTVTKLVVMEDLT
jgi:hypothetical protein